MVAVEKPSAFAGAAPLEGPDPLPFVRTDKDGARLELAVRGARCAGCLKKIEGALAALPGVSSARLNLSTGKLVARFAPSAETPRAVVSTLQGLGYQAYPFDPADALASEAEDGAFLLRCLGVAGFAAMNVMLLSVAVWAGLDGGEMDEGTRTLFHWISGVISIPATLYAGRPFFRSALASLRHGRANMDVPISLAVLLTLALSIVETLQRGAYAYFDASVGLLFLLLIGRYLDHLLRAKARTSARELLAMQAATATRLLPDGSSVSTPAREIAPGDRIVLLPGDRAPVDGVVENGASDADVSLVTGESAPVSVAAGTSLHAGTLNLSGRLVLRATAQASDSLVAELARLLETGEQTRNRYVQLSDKAAHLYVWLIHTAAAAVFLGWWLIGGDLRQAFICAITLLIITCPCALGLAVPAVQVVATGRLFRRGILVKSGNALERLAEADAAVFDKTGTLTLGRPQLAPGAWTDADLALAAPLARASRHPLARALARAAGDGPVAAGVRETPGQGLQATVDGATVRLGNAAFAGAPADLADGSALWLAVEGRAPVRFGFADALRADAAQTASGLRARGLAVEMLSGDRAQAAAAAAQEAGIARWQAGVTPQAKAAYLSALGSQGRKVLMVGDGLNDAPALALAHVSMAPGSAADVSQSAADLVFQGEALSAVTEALDVARAAKRRVLENFAFSAVYNALALPLAVFGLVTPLIAAVAMAGSSLAVTLNALRLSEKSSWTR